MSFNLDLLIGNELVEKAKHCSAMTDKEFSAFIKKVLFRKNIKILSEKIHNHIIYLETNPKHIIMLIHRDSLNEQHILDMLSEMNQKNINGGLVFTSEVIQSANIYKFAHDFLIKIYDHDDLYALVHDLENP